MVMQNYLAGLNPVYWQFWLGLLLVLIVLFARGGLLGSATTLLRKLRREGA
jgi:branched-chain amino acid transport system permease protein